MRLAPWGQKQARSPAWSLSLGTGVHCSTTTCCMRTCFETSGESSACGRWPNQHSPESFVAKTFCANLEKAAQCQKWTEARSPGHIAAMKFMKQLNTHVESSLIVTPLCSHRSLKRQSGDLAFSLLGIGESITVQCGVSISASEFSTRKMTRARSTNP